MMKLLRFLPGLVALAIGASGASAQVTTSQYDNLRTGATLNEKTLTPQNVNASQFGKLGAFKVDGAVYAQPLFLPAVEIPGKGKHDVLFVATERDSVYAFDAYRPNDAPLWRATLLDKRNGEEPVPARDVQCPFIQPEVGITSTPVQPGAHRHLLLQPGKGSMIYVIDHDQMGQFHAEGDAVVQRIRMAGGGYGAMAYWNGNVYFACSDDSLRDYALENGQLKLRSSSSIRFANPGATPSVSADGNKNALVWAIATKTWNGPGQPAVLYAFDASNLSEPIFTSDQNSKRDRAGMATRFVIPLVVNGHVYFGARDEVEMYGMLK